MNKLRVVNSTLRGIRIIAVLYLTCVLVGCAGLLFGGAATTTAVVAHDTRTTGTFIEDQAIELKASEAIRGNDSLNSQVHLSVTSYNQVVLVTGQAPTDELRKTAIALVSGIEKVRHVYDEIQIAAPSSMMTRSSDSLLTAKVKTKLFTVDNIDATKVKVVSENGVVFLMGILRQTTGSIVADAASRVGGAQKIVKLFEYRD